MSHRSSVKILPNFKSIKVSQLAAKRLFCVCNHQLCNSFSTANLHLKEQTQHNLRHLQGKLLIVEGNIAAGKSVFSKRLGKHFGFVVHDEPAPKNPYLAKFYKEPAKYALKLQLWLFQQRFLMNIQSLKHIIKTGQGVILDRSVYSDLVFTNVVYKDGNISKSGYEYYLRVRKRAMELLTAPFAAIHLHTPPDICFERIAKRGREYEQQIPLSYLARLDKEHKDIFDNLSKTGVCPVLTYDWSEFGRSTDGEELTGESDGELQFYASGFSKIVSDIRGINTTWKPVIPDAFLRCDSESDIVEAICSVDGYEQISDEILEKNTLSH